ncbi:MAG: ligase-associated DNA damage response endonuclease PdeM [Leptolyngbya sp. SIO1D8]|nr:ligase-associated DNA damage response endonuclease PdeM [Leptolyngbya sp. SIO1D8]
MLTPISLQGTQLELLPEKAAFSPELETLFVSDVHLGKSETFQQFGIPIPNQVNDATLQRLKQARDRTGASQVFILGDLFHGPAGLVDEVIDGWLRFLNVTQLEAHLILGNHDRALLDRLSQLSLTCYTQPIQYGAWVLSHEPLPVTAGITSDKTEHLTEGIDNSINICGHVHPCVRLGGKGDRMRLPCFYWEPNFQRLTLPSFGDFTGGYTVSLGRRANATAYVIAENAVIPFTSSEV